MARELSRRAALENVGVKPTIDRSLIAGQRNIFDAAEQESGRQIPAAPALLRDQRVQLPVADHTLQERRRAPAAERRLIDAADHMRAAGRIG